MERLTGALLDRLTHHVHILEINGECYRLKQSRQTSVMPTSDCPETPLPGRLEMTPLRITHPDIFAGQLAMTLMLDGVLPGALFDRSSCSCSGILSSLTVKRKCPHDGECDIDAERADKASGPQQLDG